MRRFALALALFVLALPAEAHGPCDAEALTDTARQQCERGRADALRDMAEGEPEWHWFGLPDLATPVVDQIMRERYGLRRVFHGDVVWDHEDHYADGYNAVVYARLAPRFGDDFVARAHAEAEALFPGQEVLNPKVLRDIPAPPGSCVGDERCVVFVAFEIAPSGEPADLRVMRSPDSALNEPARAAAALVRFRPAADAENGRSGGSYTVPVLFVHQ